MEAATESYSCDFPWGGVVEIDNLRAEQGKDTDNNVMISFGSEHTNPVPHTAHSFTMSNSTLRSTGVANAIGIRIDPKYDIAVILTNVHFSGIAAPVIGKARYKNCTNNGKPIPNTIA